MMTEDEYIKQRLDDQHDWYSKKAQWNQTRYMRLRVIEVITAAGIPFATTLLTAYQNLTWLVALLAFVIAAASGLVALHKYQDNWMEYRSTAEALKREKLLFLTRTPPYDAADPFHALVERVEALLARESAGWVSYMRQAGAQGGQLATGPARQTPVVATVVPMPDKVDAREDNNAAQLVAAASKEQ
jgi:uncharacterized protein DUF4231